MDGVDKPSSDGAGRCTEQALAVQGACGGLAGPRSHLPMARALQACTRRTRSCHPLPWARPTAHPTWVA